MITLEDVLTLSEYEAMVDGEYIKEQTHPEFPELVISNYTEAATWDRVWNHATMTCRGLIWNRETREVLARPFPKFFNYGEREVAIPDEPFEVLDKADGSLGISHQVRGQMAIATRGSFASDQAIMATHMLHTKYADAVPLMVSGLTYLFEIVGPENRIVLKYNESELILLAVVDTHSGVDLEVPKLGFQYGGRMAGSVVYKSLPGYCRQGLHEMTSENIYVQPKTGWAICRSCKKTAAQRYRVGRSPEKARAAVERARTWRQENREQSRALALRHYDKIRSALTEAKNVPCMDCGQRFPPYVMDFHHVVGKKEYNLGTARSLKKLREEMAKCIVICANCHRIRTWEGNTRATR